MARILSIQSQLVYGIAGNNAAVPILQRGGHTVYAVPTALLSNTPVYPGVAGNALDAADVDALLGGLLERTGAGGIDAILTGYMARADTVAVVARRIAGIRAAHPGVRVHVDPVIGDERPGRYVRDGVAEAIAERLVPLADVLCPNAFEVAWLAESLALHADPSTTSREQAEALARHLGRPLLASGICGGNTAGPGDVGITTLYTDGHDTLSSTIVRRACAPTGTGDALAALFLDQVLNGAALPVALDAAVGAMGVLLDDCVQHERREMDLSVLPYRLPVTHS